MRFILLAASTAMLLAACGEPDSLVISADDAQSAFETDDQRILYTIGTRLGLNVEELRLNEDEVQYLAEGMRDAILGVPYQVDIDVYGPRMQEYATRKIEEGFAAREEELAAEKVAGLEFADTVAAEPGAERSASGLVFVPVTEGDGEMPEARDRVVVHYHGTLRDGSVFDSSKERDMPATFALNEVIPCWTEALQKMRVGATARLVCPSTIAYGDQGRPPVIPGGAALLFEVELLDIVQ